MKTFSASRPFRTLKNRFPFALLALSLLPAARAAEAPGRGLRVESEKPVTTSPREGNASLWVGVNTAR